MPPHRDNNNQLAEFNSLPELQTNDAFDRAILAVQKTTVHPPTVSHGEYFIKKTTRSRLCGLHTRGKTRHLIRKVGTDNGHCYELI